MKTHICPTRPVDIEETKVNVVTDGLCRVVQDDRGFWTARITISSQDTGPVARWDKEEAINAALQSIKRDCE